MILSLIWKHLESLRKLPIDAKLYLINHNDLYASPTLVVFVCYCFNYKNGAEGHLALVRYSSLTTLNMTEYTYCKRKLPPSVKRFTRAYSLGPWVLMFILQRWLPFICSIVENNAFFLSSKYQWESGDDVNDFIVKSFASYLVSPLYWKNTYKMKSDFFFSASTTSVPLGQKWKRGQPWNFSLLHQHVKAITKNTSLPPPQSVCYCLLSYRMTPARDTVSQLGLNGL